MSNFFCNVKDYLKRVFFILDLDKGRRSLR